jgi:sialate O-acetylesterase
MSFAFLLAAVLLQAENLRLAHIFSDHMVLQRETDAPVWGWGEPGKTVTVLPSWSLSPVSAKVAADGTWRVSVKTAQAGGPYTLTVRSGRESLVLEDILLGEV